MSDKPAIVDSDRLTDTKAFTAEPSETSPLLSNNNSSSSKNNDNKADLEEGSKALRDGGFEQANVSTASGLAECRICQEEEEIANLEVPCVCSGSVKFAHRKCVQRWCNEKGDTMCEICHQPYQGGYTISTQPVHCEGITIDISEEWDLHTTPPFELRNPRILAMAAAQRHMLEAEYNEYTEANSSSGLACCRSVALILMFLLLLRHVLSMAVEDGDDDASSMYFTLFMLRTAGFLLPCYIMIRAMNLLQRRREEQEAAMTAAEVAILIQAGQARGMQLTLVPGPPGGHRDPV